MENYKFKSDLVQRCLPTGATHIEHIKREEVSPLLEKIIKNSKTDRSFLMFTVCRVKGNNAWLANGILEELKMIEKDIDALKWKLTT